MPRRFINQLGDRDSVDEIFLVNDKQLRANRNGNLYLQLRLSDKTGSVTGMLWNANDSMYQRFENGDYLRIHGTAQVYNGAVQIIVNRFEAADLQQVDEADFVTMDVARREVLSQRLSELLRGVSNFHLRNLAESYLIDETFMANFASAPAGIKNHHAYRGGLLEHVVSLMELAQLVAPRYPDVDGDLLLLGAFLHDSGKTRELAYERDLSYTDEGQMLGHIMLGVQMLDEKFQETERLSGERVPDELQLRLRHMLVSHHGEYEYGSPKLPMTPEAVALHLLDNLDAKLHCFHDLIAADVNSESTFTPYQPSLGRKLYKGNGAAE